jgi:hypothetical protein
MSQDPKPFDASFGASDRYKQPQAEEARVSVVVDGETCPGHILGRNGPRVQVRFEREGGTYVRWFDADAVVTDETVADDSADDGVDG